jgi:hypothetical protein
MTTLSLRLGAHSFQISRKTVVQKSEFFFTHPDLFDNPVYAVESDVDVDDFRTFLDFFQTQDESLVTTENYRALGALADEFGVLSLFDLCAEIGTAQMNANLADRVSALEESVSQQSQVLESLGRDSGRALSEFLAGKLLAVSSEFDNFRSEIGLELQSLRSEIELLTGSSPKLKSSIADLRSEIQALKQFEKRANGELKFVWKSIHSPEERVEIQKGLRKQEPFTVQDLGDMDKVIANEATRELFSQFLKARLSDEMLGFYMEVQEYRKMNPRDRKSFLREFDRISDTYLGATAPRPINAPGFMLEDILRIPERARTTHAFDDAWEENRKIMRLTMFESFRDTAELKEYARTLKPFT